MMNEQQPQNQTESMDGKSRSTVGLGEMFNLPSMREAQKAVGVLLVFCSLGLCRNGRIL